MYQLVTIKLADLRLNPEINPRTDAGDVSTLISQIRLRGFNDPLWVRKTDAAETLDIIDGSRRFKALQILTHQGHFDGDFAVDVMLFDCDLATAREMALATHQGHANLTPADEAEAFYRLKLSGLDNATIAARFAVSEKLVRQRIAIGTLPKEILQALREGKITLESAMAFTLSTSPERQLAVFNELQHLSPFGIRQSFTDKAVDHRDYRARFVGAESYEQVGGVITRDLFSEALWFEDEALLQSLYDDKLALTLQGLKDEGWSFVDLNPKNFYGYVTEKPKGKSQLTEAQQERLVAALAELAVIDAQIKTIEDSEDLQWDKDLNDKGVDLVAEIEAHFSGHLFAHRLIERRENSAFDKKLHDIARRNAECFSKFANGCPFGQTNGRQFSRLFLSNLIGHPFFDRA